MTDGQKFREEIKAFLITEDVSQSELARWAGMARQTLSRAIKNNSSFEPATVRRLKDAMRRKGFSTSIDTIDDTARALVERILDNPELASRAVQRLFMLISNQSDTPQATRKLLDAFLSGMPEHGRSLAVVNLFEDVCTIKR